MTRYLSVLITTIPDQCFNSLESEKFRTIDLPRLMPALKNCPEYARKRARMFVENHCIKLRKCKDSSVHNMCFFLYSRSPNSSDMLDYLRREEDKINNGLNIYLDLTYALNEAKKQQNECERFPNLGENARLDSKSLAERIKNLKKA